MAHPRQRVAGQHKEQAAVSTLSCFGNWSWITTRASLVDQRHHQAFFGFRYLQHVDRLLLLASSAAGRYRYLKSYVVLPKPLSSVNSPDKPPVGPTTQSLGRPGGERLSFPDGSANPDDVGATAVLTWMQKVCGTSDLEVEVGVRESAR